MRRLSVAALVALCAAVPAVAIDAIVSIPEISLPVSAPLVVSQLRADLALLSVPTTLLLPPSAVPLSASAWSNVRVALAAPAAAGVAPDLAPAAAAAPEAVARGSAAAAAARERLAFAGRVLGGVDPGAFASLSDAERAQALARVWDGWRERGLAAEAGATPAVDASRAFDALILEGVDDKTLTHSNKSIFLGVGVLGYPLEDAVWLSRTNIRTAIDENSLVYPEGQRWSTSDGTPEFLGQTPVAQKLLDEWGAATKLGAQIVRQAEAGSRELPKSDAASSEAAALFADVAADLVRAHDREALDYLSGQDPTFSAFLLDARKPGYYLYNGDRSVVARILATPSAARLGLRHVEHPDTDAVVKSTYYYRPERVAARLRSAALEAAPHAEAERSGLQDYARRAAALVVRVPRSSSAASAYSFVAPEFLPGSALDSAENRLNPNAPRLVGTSDLPLTLGTLRARLASGEPHPLIDPARWRALTLILRSDPALASAPADQYLRFVSQPWQTRGKAVAPVKDRYGKAAAIQLSALDELAALDPKSEQAARRVRFLRAALQAALR
jgi:hypothetical protein